MFDLVTVSNFTIDLIISPQIVNPSPTLGGPPTYVSLVARQLGSKVAVISKVGKDFSKEYILWLKANNIDLSGLKLVKEAWTTRFILKYKNGKRQLQLRNRAPTIFPEDVPNSLNAKIIHISPVTNEVAKETVDRLRTLTDLLSLDPQGFVRKFDNKGKVHLKKWKNLAILEKIDIFKSTSEEMRAVIGLSNLRLAMRKIHELGVKVVLVTKGAKGSALFFEEKFYDIPLYRPKILLDPTGAGDTLIGAFLAEYVKGENPVWCACVGAGAASVKIESIGSTLLGGKEEIYKRAAKIFKKV